MSTPRERADRVNAAIAAWRATPEGKAWQRVLEARDAFYDAARAYGIDTQAAILELHIPLSIRIDAYLYRVERERASWARMMAAPLFRVERSPQVAA